MKYFVHILLFFGGLLTLVGCRDTRPRMLGFSGGRRRRFSGLCAHAPLLEKLQFPYDRFDSSLSFGSVGSAWGLWFRLGAARCVGRHCGGQHCQRPDR